MKTLRCVVLGWLALTALVAGASAQTPAAHASHAVVERGAHHRVWQQVAWATNRLGQVVARTNAYTELATGLHRFQNGNWQEASAVIESFPDGAIARQGQYQVVFASDAATVGAIDLETPEGKRLRSHLIGLGYYDEASGRSVLIAEVTNCVGVVVPPNQVLYENAFTGLKASIRYSITLSAFEQDVLILEQPPAPERFGLSSTTTRLQVITEFLSPPAPLITEDAGGAADALALPDPVLDFGVMKMGRGLAFPAGNSEEPASESVPVGKRWDQSQGRQFLLEEVKLPAVRQQLEALPVKQASATGTIRQATREPQWPERLVARSEPRQPMQMAKLDSPPHGFVLDYTLMTSETNFTFQSGHTYYVSGTVNLSGTTTIEAAAILKYTNTTSAKLNLLGPVICATAADQPAVFTAKDDDTVGEIITGSTGSPSGYYGYMLSGPAAAMTFHDCRFAYASRAITHSGNLSLTNVQFVACSRPIYVQSSDLTITVDNALFYTNGMIFDHGIGTIFCGQHLTVQQAGSIAATSGSVDCSIYLTNSLIAGLTSWGKNVEDSYTNQVAWLSSGAGLFQSVGAGTHYLAESSPYRDVGTTNLGADFLAAIQAMTTYPPPASTVDTNTPDLGYHYPVLTDFDLDGMEDGWEWKHFGTVTNNGSGDYDNDGTSDYAEFSGESEPNNITALLQFTNLWVANSNISGAVEVLSGVPWSIAMQGDTNFANAVWTNYLTNFTATLGTTDGVYEVWIGLRGRTEDSEQTWLNARLTLDQTPPLLVLTSPTSTTGSVPLIQIQGYAPEPIESLWLTLSNAAGVNTNLQGFVKDQQYDTNLMAFTTNFFQAYDLVFTNGDNFVTIHAVDLAGNVSALSTNYVLESDGSAPVLRYTWPQDGMRLSGETITVEGWLDDPSAVVGLAVTSTNGVTNFAAGLVERYGRLWVEEVPLVPGTNWLTLTAVDVWGNPSSTNLHVIKCDLGLEVTSLPTNELHQMSVNIAGTLTNAGYTVWVNGVQAEFNGGQWEAQNVPVNGGPTAVFNVTAYPPDENPTPDTNNPTLNPPTTNAVQAAIPADKPERCWLETDTQTTIWHNETWWTENGTKVTRTHDTFYNHVWNDQKTNQGIWRDVQSYGNYVCEEVYTWTPSSWPFVAGGTAQGFYGCAGSWACSPPEIAGEHCDVEDDWPPCEDGFSGVIDSYKRNADSKILLFTGSKPIPGRPAIFALQGMASEILFKRATPSYYGLQAQRQIPNDQIVLGAAGPLGSDGFTYKRFGVGEIVDITPRVKNKPFYCFSADAGKHVLRHKTYALTLTNRDDNRTKLGVGEQVEFKFYPPLGMHAPEQHEWTTTAGSVEPIGPLEWGLHGSYALFTAPSNATPNVVVKVEVRNAVIETPFEVVEPQNYDGAYTKIVNTYKGLYETNKVAARMFVQVHIAPVDVSFYRVQIAELFCHGSDIEGYFQHFAYDTNITDHATSGVFVSLWEDNSLTSGGDTLYWNPRAWPYPGCNNADESGSFHWDIPVVWKIPGGQTNEMTHWTQTFSVDSQGTMTLGKFGTQMTRTTNDVVNPQLP